MKASEYARSQIEGALDFLAICAKDMTSEQYNFDPPGNCNSAAKLHVHALSGAEFFVTVMLRKQPSTWPAIAEKTALPTNAREIWGSDVAIDPAVIAEYAAAIKGPALDYIGTLSDEDLGNEFETQFAGKQTVAWVLQLVASHTIGHAGEISAIKGIQGLKGLPF